jgi:hypothetical protein
MWQDGYFNAPTAAGLAGDESDAFGRMARGSAGMAELVHTMHVFPWQVIESFEAYARQPAGVFMNGQAWSLEAIARSHVAQLEGHRTLAKTIVILAHAYELCRQSPNSDPRARAFLGQSFKCALEASNNKGSWNLVWPLLGLPDPDDKSLSLMSAAEKVGVAAYQKEKTILEKSANAARGSKED